MDLVRTCRTVDMLRAFLWAEDNYLTVLQTKQSGQYTRMYNRTLRRVRVTIVVVEKK
jgi:hypothetical protein